MFKARYLMLLGFLELEEVAAEIILSMHGRLYIDLFIAQYCTIVNIPAQRWAWA